MKLDKLLEILDDVYEAKLKIGSLVKVLNTVANRKHGQKGYIGKKGHVSSISGKDIWVRMDVDTDGSRSGMGYEYGTTTVDRESDLEILKEGLDEAITVQTDNYFNTHLKLPSKVRDYASWVFKINGKEEFITGKYKDALKQAKAVAKKAGVSVVTVLP